MDCLGVALELIAEAKREKDRLEVYKKEYEIAEKKDWKNNYSWTERNKVNDKYRPIPRKVVINENIKTARRLLLREYM